MGQFAAGKLWRGVTAAAVLAAGCSPASFAARPARPPADPWAAAVSARRAFENQPAGTHTRADYAHVMDGFRAIYHGDPNGRHAAEAIAQVAELLAEEGRELNDPHELAEAAGQYEYLAKSHPGTPLASSALGHAFTLYGPENVNSPVQRERVRAELLNDYPRSREARAAQESAASRHEPQPAASPVHAEAAPAPAPPRATSAPPQQSPAPVVRPASDSAADTLSHKAAMHGAPATLTSIRHWSTSDYTRVAIDLGADVQYEAARVEGPDRIFFDLHHTRLAPGLEGKSFVVNDDGFLTRIRAAQFTADTVRVVLDVHKVTEYSAFLLPNPFRLIIDIHGRRAQPPATTAIVSAPSAGRQPDQRQPDQWSAAPQSESKASSSTLPPMPVTDASAGFGLPSRTSATPPSRAVAQPRVVVPSQPTDAHPVPNTVATSSGDATRDVAAVSSQPGKVQATHRPTSLPVMERAAAPPVPKPVAVDLGTPGAPPTSGRDRRAASATPSAPAPPTAAGETSLTRALGLKIGRIVIDAGHGGHDSGTLGAGGLEEKDVVLDVALRLGRMLHDRLGAEIVYTRADDTFIPLETRTAIANKAQADLFISIHANSSADAGVRGVEVYYLNFTSDQDSMRVAARENAVSNQSVHELSELVQKIALKDKVEESHELAVDVDKGLYGGLAAGNAGLKDRGVKKAPFVVLIGANMPSVLAEISFVTNPQDAGELRTPAYRQRVAESLYRGVAQYAQTINGTPAPRGKTSAAAADRE